MASSKRGPSVLVTDSRERQPSRGVPQRSGIAGGVAGRSQSMRFMTVDNVLQHASEIPSGQPRMPPPGAQQVRAAVRRGSHGALVASGSATGGGLPTLASTRTGQQNVPSRTTKVSGKLVLLPETGEKDTGSSGSDEDDLLDEAAARRLAALITEDENRPLQDEELDVLRKRGGIRGKSFAERLTKVQRSDKVARLTAYCTAQAFKMKATAEFLRTKHEAKTKLYDDCLYTAYHLPLLPGTDGYRLRSRPILKTPGTGKTVLDLEIERSERRDEHEGLFDDYAYGLQHNPCKGSPAEHDDGDGDGDGDGTVHLRHAHDEVGPMSPVNRVVADAKNFAEMFVFSYGVVVFWNFSEKQEKGILADLTFAETAGPSTSLVNRPLDHGDYETEEFHFEYSPYVKRPRVFNDMITLLPRSDHMVKLAISHAIAQSTKLCFFEERMSQTMLNAQHVPKRLALTGELNMTRTEIVKILGRLFKSRVDINLSSNVLDVPNFFWDSEPTLHPLYVAVREYLEIDPRIRVLNERCRVFLDLAEILSDSVADAKMSAITWIIILLIVVSILVTVTEVALRFGMLSKSRGEGGTGTGTAVRMSRDATVVAGQALSSIDLRDLEVLAGRKGGLSLEDVRVWMAALSEKEQGVLCAKDTVGRTFADG